MRLLVLVNHFSPDRGGGGAVYSDMCYALAERGVDVTVYCPYPFYPEWKDKSGRNGLSLWRYRENGVAIVRYGFFIPSEPRSLWQRMLFEATLLVSLIRLVPSAIRYDAVMVYCPYFSAVVAAGVLKTLLRKPIWLNVQDVATQAAVATGMVRSRWAARLLARTERFFFNRADIWSSISPVMIDKLKPLRDRGQPILFLPNWIDVALAKLIAEHPKPVPLLPRAPVRLLYAGNIGRKQDLIRFCKFLHESDAPFEFRIFGAGGGAEELKPWLASLQDGRFSFGPFLDAPRLAQELAWADLYVITEQSSSGDSFFPSKLVTGMAAGTPILAVCDGQSPLGQEMRKSEPGPHFEWSELGKVPKLLSQLTEDATDLQRWHWNALSRAAYYDRDPIINRLIADLEQMAQGRPVSVQTSLGEVAYSR